MALYILAEEKDLVLLPDELTYLDGAQVACGFGPCVQVEDDISQLLLLMCVREDVVQRMIAQVSKGDTASSDEKSGASLETQKKNALARCQRRLQAAKRLFRDGDMEEAEYDAIVRETDDEIQSWQHMTNEQTKN